MSGARVPADARRRLGVHQPAQRRRGRGARRESRANTSVARCGWRRSRTSSPIGSPRRPATSSCCAATTRIRRGPTRRAPTTKPVDSTPAPHLASRTTIPRFCSGPTPAGSRRARTAPARRGLVGHPGAADGNRLSAAPSSGHGEGRLPVAASRKTTSLTRRCTIMQRRACEPRSRSRRTSAAAEAAGHDELVGQRRRCRSEPAIDGRRRAAHACQPPSVGSGPRGSCRGARW